MELIETLCVISSGIERARLTVFRSGDWMFSLAAWDDNLRFVEMEGATRPDPGGAFRHLKHGSRIELDQPRNSAGTDEVLFVNERGEFTEGSRAGILCIRGATIVSAPYDGRILPSVTVSWVCVEAERAGFIVERRYPKALWDWDEILVCNALRGACAIVLLDNQMIRHRSKTGNWIRALLQRDGQ